MRRFLSALLILVISIMVFTGCPTEPKVINVKSVSLNKTELTLTVGESYTLVETIEPENADNKNVA